MSLKQLSNFILLYILGFRKNDEMKAMDVLPILKEKVAYLSGKPYYAFFALHHSGV